jgi:imidazolonepropionase
MSLSIVNAGQVLRPASDGQPYLRRAELLSEPGAVAVRDGVIAAFEAGDGEVIDARGGAVVPGFVDCHTHLPFAGWRAGEYEMKVTGVPYEEIARSGGGIASSARALASSSDEDVLAQARGIRAEMLRLGTTTL